MASQAGDGTVGADDLTASEKLGDDRRVEIWMIRKPGENDTPAGWEIRVHEADGPDAEPIGLLQLLFGTPGRDNDPFDGLKERSRSELEAFLKDQQLDRHIVRRVARRAMSGTGWKSPAFVPEDDVDDR